MSVPFVHKEPFTEQLLTAAGIAPGMRVIDLGCGGGLVSLLLAERVGPEGQVVGVDQNERALDMARELAARQGLTNTTFLKQDLSEPLPPGEPFDAAVGRRVLMYLPNAVSALRQVAANLRPGGLAVFQEADATMPPGRRGAFPLHDQLNDWIWQTVAREGANLHMGFDLPAALEEAGLSVQGVRGVAEIEYGAEGALAMVVRAMEPRIVHHGVATREQLDVTTVDARLAAERAQAGGMYVRNLSFGVWARKDGGGS